MCDLLLPLAPTLDARSASTAIYSIGSLGSRRPDLLAALERALLPRLADCPGLGLGLACWGFKRAGHAPGGAWWAAARARAGALAAAGQLHAEDAVKAARAAAALAGGAGRVRSAPDATDAADGCAAAQRDARALLALACAVCAAQAPRLGDRTLASLLWCCARAPPRPLRPWPREWLLPALARLAALAAAGEARPQALCNALWALPRVLPERRGAAGALDVAAAAAPGPRPGDGGRERQAGRPRQQQAQEGAAAGARGSAAWGGAEALLAGHCAALVRASRLQLPGYGPTDMAQAAAGAAGLAAWAGLESAGASVGAAAADDVGHGAGSGAASATVPGAAGASGGWARAFRPLGGGSVWEGAAELGGSSAAAGSEGWASSGEAAAAGAPPASSGGGGAFGSPAGLGTAGWGTPPTASGPGASAGGAARAGAPGAAAAAELSDELSAFATELRARASRVAPLFPPPQAAQLAAALGALGLDPPRDLRLRGGRGGGG